MGGEHVYAGTINRTLRLLTDCQNVADGLQMRGEQIYAGAINRTPTAANNLPKCYEQIAKTIQTDCQNAHNELPQHIQHKHKNTTIVHHPTVTYFIKHTYSLTLIHIIYNIMHIFNCLRKHLDNTKTAETYLNINLLKICKRLIFFTL